MVVSDIDLRLLRVFKGVVESGGYSNAQTALGVSQSTISTQMSQLEVRVGFTLCHRGRSGFRLTSEGEEFYKMVLNLLLSLDKFQTNTAELKKGLTGNLRIGFLDNIISDDNNPLRYALSQFVELPENSVHISIESLSPSELEKGVLNQNLDAAIGIFEDKVPGLDYRPLYSERDILTCHKDHPLAHIKEPHVLDKALPHSRRVVRDFLGYREFRFESNAELIASVTSLEASAFLILTGKYIGFLPAHYAKPWIDSGEMIALTPDKFNRESQFYMITRDSVKNHSRALTLFIQCINKHTGNTSKIECVPFNQE